MDRWLDGWMNGWMIGWMCACGAGISTAEPLAWFESP